MSVGFPSGTQTTPNTSASSANLTQLTNLTNAWQLDPANLTEQYGLHIFGSGSPTGLVVDSGSAQVLLQAEKLHDSAACHYFLGNHCTHLLLFGQQLACCTMRNCKCEIQNQFEYAI